MKGDWMEFSAFSLGQEVGSTVTQMIRERDEEIARLRLENIHLSAQNEARRRGEEPPEHTRGLTHISAAIAGTIGDMGPDEAA